MQQTAATNPPYTPFQTYISETPNSNQLHKSITLHKQTVKDPAKNNHTIFKHASNTNTKTYNLTNRKLHQLHLCNTKDFQCQSKSCKALKQQCKYPDIIGLNHNSLMQILHSLNPSKQVSIIGIYKHNTKF